VYTSKEDKFQLLDKAIQFHDGNSIIAVSIVCLGLSLFLELVYYSRAVHEGLSDLSIPA
jgi:hypothetical protein